MRRELQASVLVAATDRSSLSADLSGVALTAADDQSRTLRRLRV